MASQQQGVITQIEHTGGDLVLLVREDAFSQEYANSVFDGLDGANICVSVGSEIENQLVNAFSSRNIAFTTIGTGDMACLLYTSPSPRDQRGSRMPSSA